jgi:hypothetical protein
MSATFWAALAAIATLVTAIITAVYTFYTGRMVKGELGPKLFIKSEVKDTGNNYDRSVNEGIGLPDDYKKIGFVSELADKMIIVKLINNGVAPATNIKLKYTIILYKHYVEFEPNSRLIDIDTAKLIEYKKITRTILVDYLPPNDQIEKPVMFIDYFPFVKVQVNLLKSDSSKFIKKEAIILDYHHPSYETIADSNDMRFLFGGKWMDKNS